MILVDSNVIIDVAQNDAVWGDRSSRAIAAAINNEGVAINAIIYAEIASNYSSIELLEESMASMSLRKLNMPYDAAYLAGRAFRDYRRRGGQRESILPDFLIGAHAAVEDFTLLTRDPRRYRRAFPTLKLIAP